VATVTDSEPWVRAVRASHDRLSGIVAGLDADGLRTQSYAKEWTIADVLSHLGSGAEIFLLSLTAGVTGAEPPTSDDFQPIWATWNARSPEEQAAQCVLANETLVSRVESLTAAEREAFSVVMFGAMTMDLAGLLGMRLSEHAIHTWDVAVVLDPDTLVAPDAVDLMIDGLSMIIGFTGKKQEPSTVIAVTTTDPDRSFTLDTGGVTLAPGDPEASAGASLVLSAEAFVRLVYGRLDDATELTAAGVTLPGLQGIFPGF
jgi:uncharacterized protein (TIGR03083 family)